MGPMAPHAFITALLLALTLQRPVAAAALEGECPATELRQQTVGIEGDKTLQQQCQAVRAQFDAAHNFLADDAERKQVAERFILPHVWLANATVRQAAQVNSGDTARLRLAAHRHLKGEPMKVRAGAMRISCTRHFVQHDSTLAMTAH